MNGTKGTEGGQKSQRSPRCPGAGRSMLCGGGGELRILGNRMQRPSRYKVSVGMGAG